MTSHARAEQLIAAAMDFRLTAAEETEVAEHLAACQTCRVQAAAYRSDAAAIRTLAYAEPPAFVRVAVFRAVARPARRSIEPWKLLVAAALLLTALLGAAAISGAWNPRPALVVVVPSASPGVGPTETPRAGPTGAPIVGLDPTTARWTKVGGVDASGPLVGSDDGYAMLTSGPDWAFGDVTSVGFSTDGQRWESTNLANPVTNCPGWGPAGDEQVNDAAARAIATNGLEFVVVGEEQPHDAAGCAGGGSYRPVAWYSSDGRTWQRSAPFEVGAENGRATAVWATPTGWQAAVEGGPNAIWESVDGLSWYLVAGLASTMPVSVGAGSALDGTLVFADPQTRGLTTSTDGRTWAPALGVEDCNAAEGASQIVGPTAQGLDAWVIAFDMRILCSSHDLASWSGTTMTGGLGVVAQTRYGAIAAGDTCFGAGVTCAPDPWAYLSTDGATWRSMEHPPVSWGRVIADGPAGVLMIGQGAADGGLTTVWRLDPGTATTGASDAAAALEITCDGSSTDIPTPRVKTQPDGVHIAFANPSGRALTFGIEDQFGGEVVPSVGGMYVYTFGPGDYRLTCVEDGSDLVSFTVIDPDGLFTSADMSCDGRTAGTIDYAQGATGAKGSVVDVARTQLRGIEPGDLIERAGYSGAVIDQRVRVVRAGQVVAVLGYSADGKGGWLSAGEQVCSGSGITVVPPA